MPELLAGEWEVGRFTDDTQMAACVAEWLAYDAHQEGKRLLERFCRAYEPWRHYGPGARLILEAFPNAGDKWPELATSMFPQGSYGNGSAMRVALVGLFFDNDLPGIIKVARISSMVTHSHSLAVQGAVLQAAGVALAVRGPLGTAQFLRVLKMGLASFEEIGQDTSVYKKALTLIAKGIEGGVSPDSMAGVLGNGIKAHEAVPMAIYCFLANPSSFEKAVESAVFIGGDTDTIASMTAALAGAALGESQIPERWLRRVTETTYTPAKLRQLALKLYETARLHGFKAR